MCWVSQKQIMKNIGNLLHTIKQWLGANMTWRKNSECSKVNLINTICKILWTELVLTIHKYNDMVNMVFLPSDQPS